MAEAKQKTAQLGSLWQEVDSNGEATGKVYITLHKDITGISLEGSKYVEGSAIPANNGKIYINANDPFETEKFRLDKEYINQEEYEKRVARLEDLPNLIAELTIKVG